MRKKKQNGNSDQPVQTENLQITYDPIEPQYNALHRAGMVGLALQIKAMEKGDTAPRPQVEWIAGGRGIALTLDLQGLRALLQERYLGVNVTIEIWPRKTRKGKGSDAKPEVKTRSVPRLRYLEVFGAHDLEKRQKHLRFMYYQSFFQIPPENQRFFKAPEADSAAAWRNSALDEDAEELWQALLDNETIDIQKSTRPNSVKYDLKGVRLRDIAKQVLLLHFWPITASFFSSAVIRYDNKLRQLVDDSLPPIIVVPDVSHIKNFYNHTIRSYARDFSSPVINTPVEAVLAFYVAPRLAHGQAITEEVFNEFVQSVRGATVFGYRRPLKRGRPDPKRQPEVRVVYEEAYSEEKLQSYLDLMRQGLKAPPYRALRVRNLIVEQPWYYGFDSLVNEWPLELFVPVKNRNTNLYGLKPKGMELADDLSADLKYFAKEHEMDDAESKIPALIDKLVDRYLYERVFGKGQTSLDRKKLEKNIFPKDKKARSPDEQKLVAAFNDKHSKGVNQEFVDFRGATDQRRFTELFVARLFDPNLNAPYTAPEERAMLRTFYEEEWEGARWLTLMAISAAGAPRPSNKPSVTTTGEQTNDAAESQRGVESNG
jgi:CRISPR-associated protein Cmx8